MAAAFDGGVGGGGGERSALLSSSTDNFSIRHCIRTKRGPFPFKSCTFCTHWFFLLLFGSKETSVYGELPDSDQNYYSCERSVRSMVPSTGKIWKLVLVKIAPKLVATKAQRDLDFLIETRVETRIANDSRIETRIETRQDWNEDHGVTKQEGKNHQF